MFYLLVQVHFLRRIDHLFVMSFSPFGPACVAIRAQTSARATATVSREFNTNLPFSLLIGIIHIFFSNSLSKSKVFQYSSAVLIFIVLGILILGIYSGKRLVFKDPRNPPILQWTGMTLLLSGGYGATAVWFLRKYFRSLCLKYWEIALVRM